MNGIVKLLPQLQRNPLCNNRNATRSTFFQIHVIQKSFSLNSYVTALDNHTTSVEKCWPMLLTEKDLDPESLRFAPTANSH